MRRIICFLAIVFLCSPFAWAAIDSAYRQGLEEANELYSQSKYEQALQKYQKLSLTEATPEAYYNLGNANFKTKKLGRAIAAYEKAKLLAPRDGDIRKNLRYAASLIQSKMPDQGSLYLKEIESVFSYVSLVELQITALMFVSLIFVWMIVLLMLSRNPFRGWVLRTLTTFFIISASLCGMKYYLDARLTYAVVIRPDAEVRYGPSRDDKVVFRLPEGMKILIMEDREGWKRVQLSGKDSGWIPKDDLELIKAV